MAVSMDLEPNVEDEFGIQHLSAVEGRELLDRQAWKYLRMSGNAFLQHYRAGDIEDADRTDVLRVAMLIPLAEQ